MIRAYGHTCGFDADNPNDYSGTYLLLGIVSLIGGFSWVLSLEQLTRWAHKRSVVLPYIVIWGCTALALFIFRHPVVGVINILAVGAVIWGDKWWNL